MCYSGLSIPCTATQGQMSLKIVCFSANSYKQKYQNLSKLFTMYVCVGVFVGARGWGTCVCVCTCLQIWLYAPWFGSDCYSNLWPLHHNQNISCPVLTCHTTVNCRKNVTLSQEIAWSSGNCCMHKTSNNPMNSILLLQKQTDVRGNATELSSSCLYSISICIFTRNVTLLRTKRNTYIIAHEAKNADVRFKRLSYCEHSVCVMRKKIRTHTQITISYLFCQIT